MTDELSEDLNLSEHQRRENVLGEVYAERGRQEFLRSKGKFPWTCRDVGPSDAEKNAVLGEEVGEVAREVTESLIQGIRRTHNLRKELVQVAAVCVAWIEAIDVETER